MPNNFYRISNEQLIKDWEELGWPMTEENSLEDAVIKIPKRSTKYSAGYDFYAPINIVIKAGESMTVPTGIKAELEEGMFLMIVPRSGLGFKYQLGLANTIGIIDADYYNNPQNEGHILIKLVNRGDKDCFIFAGKAMCQGIIVPYFLTEEDKKKLNAETYENIRNGGFGSTDNEGD